MSQQVAQQSLGNKIITVIESYCICPEGDLVGRYVRLDDFQKKFILDVYDNPHKTQLAVLSIARKNGKTALIACLVIAHIIVKDLAIQNSKICSGAMSREQAAIVFNYAYKMVNESPKLKALIHAVPSKYKLIGIRTNVEYVALAKDAKRNLGGSPVLAIMDELGSVTSATDAFFDSVYTSQGAYSNPLMIIISTQANSDDSLLSIIIDDILKPIDGVFNPRKVCHLYAPDDTPDKLCDIEDRKAWKKSNPALGTFRSLDDMEKLADTAKRLPAQESSFRNLNLNQRVDRHKQLITYSIWMQNAGNEESPRRPLDKTMHITGGLDLSTRDDLTAFVLEGVDHEGLHHVWPYFFAPEKNLMARVKRDKQPYDVYAKNGLLILTPGPTVDYDHVVEHMSKICGDLPIKSIGYDRHRIEFLLKAAGKAEIVLPFVEFGQGGKSMGPAVDEMLALLLKGKYRHGNHPLLNMCARNVTAKETKLGKLLEKIKETARIDGITALAIATGRSIGIGDEPEESTEIKNPVIIL